MKQAAQKLLTSCGINDIHDKLIKLYGLHGNADHRDIRRWFDSIDFEKLPPAASCMAAVMCSENDYAGTPPALIPRLKGVLRYHRILNSGLYSCMCSIIREYNKVGIETLVMKGAAIKTGYNPNFVRPMWDVDILVKSEDFDHAFSIAQQLGFEGSWAPHSIDLKRGNLESIDLHHVFIRDIQSGKNSSYWPECFAHTWNDAKFFIPERHALLLQLIANAHTNFIQHQGTNVALRWVMDLDALINGKEPIDWNKFISLAKHLNIEPQVCIILTAYDIVLPGVIDIRFITNELGVNRKAVRQIRYVHRYHEVNRQFRNPPEGCSSAKLALIHIRWLIMECRAENPGTWLHAMACMPKFLKGELRVKSLWELPAVAIRKFKKHKTN